MKTLDLVVISDTHEYLIPPDLMPQGDVLIHCGDFTFQGCMQQIARFNEWLGQLLALGQYQRGIVVTPGNHDKTLDRNPGPAELLLTNCKYLNDSGVEINGFKFWGSPVTPTFGRDWAFNRDRYSIKPHWDLIPRDTEVLITHGPPGES